MGGHISAAVRRLVEFALHAQIRFLADCHNGRTRLFRQGYQGVADLYVIEPIIHELSAIPARGKARQSCALRTRHRAWPTTADPQNRTAPLRWVRVRHRAAARGTSRGPVPR